MVDVLVEGTDTLRVDYEHLELLSVRSDRLERLAPDPQALGARVDRGTDAKARGPLIEYDAIQQEGLACAIFTGDSYNGNFLVDLRQEATGLVTNKILLCKKKVMN